MMKKVELEEYSHCSDDCYCLRSKPKSIGYIKKKRWLEEQIQNGLKYIKLLEDSKVVGFIEYTPIEYSTRVIYGEDYLVIHCLWVQQTGNGYASSLIKHCIEEAKRLKKCGVAVITNNQTSWTPSKEIFLKNDFEIIDSALDDFDLLVYKIGGTELPYFPTNWVERWNRYSELTILRMPQCPYLEIATDNVLEAAHKLDLPATIIELKDREELLQLSPTPYGVYGVVFQQKLITFHRLTVHSAIKKLRCPI